MANKSDSDESYDRVSWEEFCISVSDSEGSAKGDRSVKDEIEGSDSDKSSDDQKKGVEVNEPELFSGNSSYKQEDDLYSGGEDVKLEVSNPEGDDNNVISAGGEDANVEVSDPEDDGTLLSDADDDDTINQVELRRNHKKRCVLEVPGIYKRPNIKSREDMELADLVKDHALPFLPAQSLSRFKAVSKEWKQWISGPLLAHKQTIQFKNLSGYIYQEWDDTNPVFMPVDGASSGICDPSLSFLPEHVAIRSSCFGLLLCQGLRDNTSYYVCNPVTQQYRKIPEPGFYHGINPAIVLSFEPSNLNISGDFEIVCAVPLMEYPLLYFEIYSSAANSWRLSATECIEVEDARTLGGGFYFNNVAYFLTNSGHVLAFDVKSELCGVLALPTGYEINGVLTRLYGELCYVHISHLDGDKFDLRVYGAIDMTLLWNLDVFLNDLGAGPRFDCRILPSVAGNCHEITIMAGSVMWLYRLDENIVQKIGYPPRFEAKCLPLVSSLVQLPWE